MLSSGRPQYLNTTILKYVDVEYNNRRLTNEILELQDRIKRLETDMAYTQKIRFVAESPEEQKIYDLKE